MTEFLLIYFFNACWGSCRHLSAPKPHSVVSCFSKSGRESRRRLCKYQLGHGREVWRSAASGKSGSELPGLLCESSVCRSACHLVCRCRWPPRQKGDITVDGVNSFLHGAENITAALREGGKEGGKKRKQSSCFILLNYISHVQFIVVVFLFISS